LFADNLRLKSLLNAEYGPACTDINEVKRQTLEHSAQYFDLLDETYPMTPPQIAASIRRQAKAIQ
jgi:hypothetical protein